MRTTIHLCQRGVSPLKCLACGELAQEGPHLRGRAPAICANRTDWETIYVGHAEYRRCIDSPDKPGKRYPVPTEEGYYWAEWRIAEDGTFGKPEDDDNFIITNQPEVVHVYDDENDGENYIWKVDVPGYAKDQSLDNFVWRSARLIPPKEDD